MFAEAFFVKYFDLARANDMYLFLAPSTYLAFGLLVNFRMTGRGGAYRTLRALSALIYYSHLWILSLVGIFLNLNRISSRSDLPAVYADGHWQRGFLLCGLQAFQIPIL